VRGCLDWQREGLGEPRAVASATRGYRSDEDSLGRFLAECCEAADPSSPAFSETTTPFAGLWDRYERWAEDNAVDPIKRAAFGKALDHRGHTSTTRRVNGKPTKVRLGLRLRSEMFEGGGAG